VVRRGCRVALECCLDASLGCLASSAFFVTLCGALPQGVV
jgi:hypothetical protein